MSRLIQMLVFLCIFTAIYLSMHIYTIFRVTHLLGGKKSMMLYIITIALALSFVVANILVKVYSNIFTKSFYAITATWMGILFILMSLLIVHHIITIFLPLPVKISAFVIIGLTLMLCIGGIINAQMINVKTVELDFPQELTVAQITDIHIGTLYNSGYLKRIVQKINKENPDVVLITGDMVSSAAKPKQHTFDALNELNAPTYAVTGNHEYYEGIEVFENMLSTTNITLLKDEHISFKETNIVGIDYSMDKSHIQKVMKNMKLKKQPTIIMHHTPPKRKYMQGDLVLSGHTHAGQIWPFNLLVRLDTEFVHGLYDVNGTKLYVSPGTRLWGPPMRIGSRNEITIFKLG